MNLVGTHLAPSVCVACEVAKFVPEVVGGSISEAYLLGVAGALVSPDEHKRFLNGEGLCPQHAADLKTFAHGEEDGMRARAAARAKTDKGRTVGRPMPVYAIPPDAAARSCRSCGARIFWIETPRGKRMPLNPDGTSHFSTCPDADSHRRRA